MLEQGPKHGWGDPVVLCLMVLCATRGALERSAAASVAAIRWWSCAVITPAFSRWAMCSASCWASGFMARFSCWRLDLGTVRDHSPLETGLVMMTSGIAQLVAAPFASIMERRLDARLVAGLGYLLFGGGLLMSGFQSSFVDASMAMSANADDDLFWPQVLRGVGTMMCLLPHDHAGAGKPAGQPRRRCQRPVQPHAQSGRGHRYRPGQQHRVSTCAGLRQCACQ